MRRTPFYDIHIEIDSSSIAIACVRTTHTVPEIIFIHRTPYTLKKNLSYKKILDTIQRYIYRATATLDPQWKNPHRIICTLTAPWYIGQTKTIHITREHSFVFSKKLLTETVEKEVALFVKNEAPALSGVTDLVLIENYTVDIRINGYSTVNPWNQKGTEAAISVHLTVAPRLFLSMIERTLNQIYGNKTAVTFRTNLFSTYLAIRDIAHTYADFLIISVGTSVTEVGIVKQGILQETGTFPVGESCIYDTQSLHPAIFTAHTKGDVTELVYNRVREDIAKAQATWNEAFRSAIDTLSGYMTIPDVVYIVAKNNTESIFTEALQNEDFGQSLTTAKKFTIESLSALYQPYYTSNTTITEYGIVGYIIFDKHHSLL